MSEQIRKLLMQFSSKKILWLQQLKMREWKRMEIITTFKIEWKNIFMKKDISFAKHLFVTSLHVIPNIIYDVVMPIKVTSRSISVNYCLFHLKQRSQFSLPTLILFFFYSLPPQLSRVGSGIQLFNMCNMDIHIFVCPLTSKVSVVSENV